MTTARPPLQVPKPPASSTAGAPPFANALGRRIATLRATLGWTQAELASRVGVQRPRLAKWELGQHPPPAEALPTLASALGTSTDHLLTGRGSVSLTGVDALEPEELDIVHCLGQGFARLLALASAPRQSTEPSRDGGGAA